MPCRSTSKVGDRVVEKFPGRPWINDYLRLIASLIDQGYEFRFRPEGLERGDYWCGVKKVGSTRMRTVVYRIAPEARAVATRERKAAPGPVETFRPEPRWMRCWTDVQIAVAVEALKARGLKPRLRPLGNGDTEVRW